MPAAVLILCEDPATDRQVNLVRMIRRVVHADTIETGKGPGIIAVLDTNMRDEDFEESVLPTLQEFRFARKVKPVYGGYAQGIERIAHCQAVIDFVDNLRPSRPKKDGDKALAKYVDAVQEWARTRDILLNETYPRIRGAG